ncbi:S8 family serine peptidase [Actimicrobium sp. CCC2.4]|uniref:S8 family peptidase n=1 Tax=Actimicrobium sp. CCC2.4 TaxID=3048606 RepID=UPI002AC94359|nr:S8 family serine peptidase [Actimicrobium sp. CCC2.4]MEB0137327.1 S8 family serine peptidase [Actimicrobium sp. CCC2.4]WPX31782.1 S8 family serine peptidase [Actimicrobium sp. CCC2.4]
MAKNSDTPSSGAPAADSSNGNGSSAGTNATSTATAAAGSNTQPAPTVRQGIPQRKGQFLIAARHSPGLQAMGLQPLAFNVIEQTLRASPDIEVIDTVGPKSVMGALADGMGAEVPSVLVARMTDQKAGILHQQAQGRLIVERDHPLVLHEVGPQPGLVTCSMASAGPALNIPILVLGKDDMPLPDAEVYLFGSMLPASGVSDVSGRVTLALYGDTPQTLRGLYIKPKADYWSFYQAEPDISTTEPNVVGMRLLSEWPSLANFPQEQTFGWGQKAMRLDQLPPNYRGQGVRVGIVDSGAATSHDDLKKIRFGLDIMNKTTDPGGWSVDTVSHGSHCAGVIAGASSTVGIRGFAPDAEVHACKLFPGGQVSQLIDALEYCIEKQVDVVNLSLGGIEPSEALEQQIQRAKLAGVACIVAAGNSGGAVQYPASSPNVLAVAALGRLNEFPQDSYHTQTLGPQVDANGFFSPKFTCYGPQIAVCAPGVAIASSVPSNNYAAWDGTSMAAPHVTGLAALVLAHHPDFQGAFKTRGPARVERLFQIIKASSQPINLGDQTRTGFGMPDVLIAVGLQPQRGMPVHTQQAFSAQPGPAAGVPVFGRRIAQGESLVTAGFNPLVAMMASGVDPGYAAYLRGMQLGLPYGFAGPGPARW